MAKSVAIVTGASQGIGRATAIRLACDFSALVLVARHRGHLDETAKALKAAGAEALVIDLDLAQLAAAKAVVHQTWAAFERIDALLNIAGAVPQIDLFEMTDEQWDGGLALKLHGARRLTIAAWPALKAAKGSVVLMSGNSALFPKAPYAAVGTINAAIVALAKAFSDRGIADGVQANSVLPGPVMTGRRRSYLEHWAPLHNMTVEEATANFPKGSWHRALWRVRRNRRADGLSRLSRRAVDDWLHAPHGRRRGEVDLNRSDGVLRRRCASI
jgi:NAD(P)-dependent dehydrogenase (short-subunit alcohol dehydrogenase family)